MNFSFLNLFIRRRYTLEQIVDMVKGISYDPEARWSDHTSLGAGTATFPLLKVRTAVQAANLVQLIRRYQPDLKLRAIGGGTNLIGADRTIPDIAYIKLCPGEDFTLVERGKSGSFLAGAALSLKNVLDFACACSHGGAAGLYGIPGTIGGASVMNAGAKGKSISEFIEYLDLLDLETGTIKRVRHKGIAWGYRHTSIGEDQMVLRVAFRFNRVDPQAENALMREEILRRMRAPAGRSAGSIFRNPSPLLPAGKILEKCGAKELNNGRFSVSCDHANWIINRTDRKEL